MAGLLFFKALKTMNKIGHTRLSSAIRIVSVSVVRTVLDMRDAKSGFL
jgi:hypothetical protein